jgi:hypothetical protein
MTYNTDPSRWSESISDTPDVLRAPFAAARSEGPSDLQMKALALKLAALSAGGAIAASAATAKAASTTAGGVAATSAASFSMAKVAISVALFGATITGAVVWQGKAVVREGSRPRATTVQVAEPPASDVRAPAAPTRAVAPSVSVENTPSTNATTQAMAPAAELETAPGAPDKVVVPVLEAAPALQDREAASGTDMGDSAVSRKTSSSRARSSSTPSTVGSPAAPPKATAGTVAGSSEVDLLRRARAALSSRPREAFELTQEHRQKFPGGMFAQERDALAIEALMRAGEMNTARGLAERFVREHPSSPHAHRFRETMGL